MWQKLMSASVVGMYFVMQWVDHLGNHMQESYPMGEYSDRRGGFVITYVDGSKEYGETVPYDDCMANDADWYAHMESLKNGKPVLFEM